MSAGLSITAGGPADRAQAAAICAAIEATLAAERPAGDTRPAVYRSRWRAAALREGQVRRTLDTPTWRG